ncbi:MAG: SRPBCC domain-containing protein, partial [Planctomycetes bacterium]|nr:SRPBCC domain-containing protein [Planctomycetota bacterium]
MTDLPYSLDRTVVICAPRDVVFRYFVDSERFAAWWGANSTIVGEVGGAVRIVYPNGVLVTGTVQRLEPDRMIAFTYGYDEGKPIPPGGSLVTIELSDHDDGTLLKLRHDVADATSRDQHVPGWRFQLSQFANVVSREQHRDANRHADAWFEAWFEPDAARREQLLRSCATDDVTMQDGYAAVQGLQELSEHIAACQVHMSSARMVRNGDVRACQGTGLCEWQA